MYSAHICEIERQINGHRTELATLQAYVPPSVRYPQEVIDWIGNPQSIEDEFTRMTKTKTIPETYLADVQLQFQRIQQSIVNGTLHGSHSHVLFAYIFSYPDMKRIVLAVTYTRPCAEGNGFIRLLLYQIARVAYATGCDIHIDEPSKAMQKILTSTFGGKVLSICYQEEDYVGGYKQGHGKQRYVLQHKELENAIDRLGVRSLLSTSPESYESTLQLNPAKFPPAEKLNYG